MTHAEQAAQYLKAMKMASGPLGEEQVRKQENGAISYALVSIAESLEKLVGAMVRSYGEEGKDYVFVKTPNHNA